MALHLLTTPAFLSLLPVANVMGLLSPRKLQVPKVTHFPRAVSLLLQTHSASGKDVHNLPISAAGHQSKGIQFKGL